MKRIFAWLLTTILAVGCLQSVNAAGTGTSQSHTYRFVVSDCTWIDAYQAAVNEGGYLAAFESVDEFNNVISQIEAQGLTNIMFRIGGRRNPTAYEYYWVNRNNEFQGEILNTPSSWTYPYWMQGEPSFMDGTIEECYLDMYYYSDEGRWVLNDVPNDILSIVPSYSGKLGYIIEFGEDQSPVASTWQSAYHNFIFNQGYLNIAHNSYGSESTGDVSAVCYALRDLDASGTPELIIDNGADSYAGSVSYLYEFADGMVNYAGTMPSSRNEEYICMDQLSLPGVFCRGAHTGAYWTDYYSYNGTVTSENVSTSSDLVMDPATGEYKVNTDPNTGDAVPIEESRTSNTTLYKAYQLILSGQGTKLAFHTLNELNQMGWDAFLAEYGYAADPADSSASSSSGSSGSANPSDILSYVPANYYFSSGAGGWWTELTIQPDGSFNGNYHDSDMGSDTENYPGGTCYVSTFTGNFTDFEKVDDYTWTMRLASLNYEEGPGSDWTDGQVHYVGTEAYGVAGGDRFYLYLPGHPVSTLPEDFMSWARMYMGYEEPASLTIYGLYNEAQGYGWCDN